MITTLIVIAGLIGIANLALAAVVAARWLNHPPLLEQPEPRPGDPLPGAAEPRRP